MHWEALPATCGPVGDRGMLGGRRSPVLENAALPPLPPSESSRRRDPEHVPPPHYPSHPPPHYPSQQPQMSNGRPVESTLSSLISPRGYSGEGSKGYSKGGSQNERAVERTRKRSVETREARRQLPPLLFSEEEEDIGVGVGVDVGGKHNSRARGGRATDLNSFDSVKEDSDDASTVASESSESGEITEQQLACDRQSDIAEDEIELEIQDERAFLEALGQLAPGGRGPLRQQRRPGDISPTPVEREQMAINLTVASATAISAAPPLPFVPAEIAKTHLTPRGPAQEPVVRRWGTPVTNGVTKSPSRVGFAGLDIAGEPTMRREWRQPMPSLIRSQACSPLSASASTPSLPTLGIA